MPLSWREIRHRAIAFSREWQGETREAAERQSFWNDFFNVFGVRRRTVATFEEPVKKLSGDWGFIDLFWPSRLLVGRCCGQECPRSGPNHRVPAGRSPQARPPLHLHRRLHPAPAQSRGPEGMKVVIRILSLVLCLVALNTPRPALSQISLVSIGHTNDGGYASAVAVAGNYAYLANASDGLRTYDVSKRA
jgi:hypothetical protein